MKRKKQTGHMAWRTSKHCHCCQVTNAPHNMSRLGPMCLLMGGYFLVGETLLVIITCYETVDLQHPWCHSKWEDVKQKEALGWLINSLLILNGPQAKIFYSCYHHPTVNGWVILNNVCLLYWLQDLRTNTVTRIKKKIQEIFTTKYIRAIYIESNIALIIPIS